jgi:hypothetical protein
MPTGKPEAFHGAEVVLALDEIVGLLHHRNGAPLS